MGISSFFKSLLGGEAETEVEEQAEQQAEQTARHGTILPELPSYNTGMPIEVLKDFDTVLLYGKLGVFNNDELVIERIPGIMSFPLIEPGTEVMIRGYDNDLSPIIMQAYVLRSSVIECAVVNWRVSRYNNHRKSIRFPLTPPANVYAIEDTRLSSPEACKLINISTGGACIVSAHSYTMGRNLRLRVELIEKGGYSSYPCQVVRIVPRKDGQFEYGLLFAQLDRRKMNQLMDDLQEIQKQTEKLLQS